MIREERKEKKSVNYKRENKVKGEKDSYEVMSPK